MTSPHALPLRIATRASRLAQWQAEYVAGLLRARDQGQAVEIVHVTTRADIDQAAALNAFGGQGAFTREVQHAVLEGRADLAVHSLKDLPTQPTEGLLLASVPHREETADCLVLPRHAPGAGCLDDLPPGARVGTGSPRRKAQLLHRRPDLVAVLVRGNVETRLMKLDRGDFDALLLAKAGLKRLGLLARIGHCLLPPEWYAAVGQGALGIECRSNDAHCLNLLEPLADAGAMAGATAERALLARLRAGCHAPVGAHTWLDQQDLCLEAVVLSRDGQTRICDRGRGPVNDAVALGQEVAQRLLARGAAALIEGG